MGMERILLLGEIMRMGMIKNTKRRRARRNEMHRNPLATEFRVSGARGHTIPIDVVYTHHSITVRVCTSSPSGLQHALHFRGKRYTTATPTFHVRIVDNSKGAADHFFFKINRTSFQKFV